MSQATFVHLRVHSEYSIVDGLVRVKSLFKSAAGLNMPAVAVTDETNLFAAIKVYKAATAAGVKPIFGADLWIEPDSEEGGLTRVALLCQNNLGYQHLTRLISKAYLEGRRHKGIPVIERAWLQADTLQGLIALSGARAGDIGQALLMGHVGLAETRLQRWLSLFDKQRFFIELQRTGRAHEEAYIQAVLPLALQYEVPVVATQDVRFLKPDDFEAHEIRVAIHEGYTLDDPKRPRDYSAEQHLCSAETMQKRFADLPAALMNTVEIAKRCNVVFNLGQATLPTFPVPAGMTESDYLCHTASAGLEKRLQLILTVDRPDYLERRQVYLDRLKIELEVITTMGFSGYFLIVADFIQWAKDNGVPVGPGRGSGAGSLVAFALEITNLDPLPYDLLFERFLNPERVSMPDFDIDFCMDGRDRVIDYVAQKYGRHSVSQIITFGSMAAKAVVRDVGRALGHPYGFVDSIAKLIPFDLGMTLSKALEDEPQLKARYLEDEEVKALIDMALKLEGTVRNAGKHAGGVVISPSLLTDFAPLYCEEGSQQLVTQFDKDDVEAAGLVKFDFLGLRNLTIIAAAVETVNELRNAKQLEPIDIDHIPLEDKASFDLLKRCETTAVFQLESRGMKDLIRRLQPDCFEDIIALVALFRPGPLQSGMVDDFINRKHGRAKIEYPHPLTADILKSTYGIILYQEQVMLIPQVLSGYTLGAADLLRRAMGKKKPEEMAKQREFFMAGAIQNGIAAEVATHIFDLMEKFAGYGFNKSHSAAYALVAYQTAWLKAHYPAAFMAAVLSSDMDNTDKVVNFIEEGQAMKLNIAAPDINQSGYRFTVRDESTILYGLGAIKGAGENAIELIIAARQSGPFSSLFDLCRRVDARKVNRRVLEALISAGALDKIGPNRESMRASLDRALQLAEQHEQAQMSGQHDLFAMSDMPAVSVTADDYIEIADGPLRERLLQEKEVLGFYLSGHPIDSYQKELSQLRCKRLNEVKPTQRNVITCFAGVVIGIRRIKTKRGSIMQIVTLEDRTGRIDITVFSELAEKYQSLLQTDQLLIVEAEVTPDEFSGGIRATVKELFTLEQARQKQIRTLHLTLTHDQAEQGVLAQLQQVLQDHSGNCPLEITYHSPDAVARFRCGDDCRIAVSDACLNALQSLIPAQQLELRYS